MPSAVDQVGGLGTHTPCASLSVPNNGGRTVINYPIALGRTGVGNDATLIVSFLTTGGTYVDDVKIAGLQHVAFKRSDVAHGRILSIDASAARKLPGVIDVLSTLVEFHNGAALPAEHLEARPAERRL